MPFYMPPTSDPSGGRKARSADVARNQREADPAEMLSKFGSDAKADFMDSGVLLILMLLVMLLVVRINGRK